MPRLPLFPLGTVLLPGGPLALQVFEHRYVVLLDDLLGPGSTAAREFGVVALRRGHEVGPESALELHPVGCTAEIVGVSPLPAPGPPRYHVRAAGVRRFSVDSLDTGSDAPYLVAEVTYLAEPAVGGADAAAVAGLAARVSAALAAYRESLGAAPVELPADPGALALRATDAMVLDVPSRQRVLEAPDLLARLRVVLEILRLERGLVGRLGAVPRHPDPGGAGLN